MLNKALRSPVSRVTILLELPLNNALRHDVSKQQQISASAASEQQPHSRNKLQLLAKNGGTNFAKRAGTNTWRLSGGRNVSQACFHHRHVLYRRARGLHRGALR
jgi:hypothetical protein